MTDKINLKLDNGKYGTIGLNDFNNQVKREQLKNKKHLLIFDRLDNGSKILEADEIEAFKDLMAHYIQNGNLSGNEADNFLTAIFGEKPKDVTQKDLFGFIKALAQKSVAAAVAGTITEKITDETGKEITVETITDENGNITKNFYNSDGKKIKQEKTVDGETMTVEYDGKGNTKVIVQNREGFKSLSELFGVDKEELMELNKDKIHTHPRTGRKFFLVGEEILIPREVEADEAILKGRKDRAGAIQDWIDERNGRIHPSPNPTPTPTPTPTPDPTPSPDPTPTPDPDPTPTPDPEPVIDIEKIKNQQKINKKAKKIANKLYDICDDNAAAIDKDIFWKELNKINKDNIVAVLDNYDKVVEEKRTDSSLLDTICSEVGASNDNRKKACKKVFDAMAQAAREAGVPEEEIKHAKKEFRKSLQHEFDKIGRVNTKDMEKSLDFLRGATAAAKVNARGGVPEMTTSEAIKAFIEGEDGLVAMNKEVQKMYKDAREEEGWVAKAGDSICGLFGCTTIEDMDAKLGKYAKDVKKLEQAAKSGDEEQFLKLYKKIFGIDFNPKAIQARQKAKENLEEAATFDASAKAFEQLEKQTKDMDFNKLSKEMKDKLKFSDEELEQVITNYAQANNMSATSDEEKAAVLRDFIKTSKEKYEEEFLKLSDGKTIEQMTKDLELLTKAAYGTNDIVKDVMQFNENQLMTDMITSAGFEIAGTIALQFIPGVGQLATAKLAVSAAKWGAKGARIASAANKVSKGFGAYTKFANSSKAAKIATQMGAAGVATAAVNFSNKKDVEETLRKTLMNMSFAGVGAASSMLAPKLMEAFGMSSVVATEVAEEIINTAGAYGITKLSGSDYTTQDGFIDFASGIVMSRISHTKLHKPTSPDVDFHPDVDPTITKPEIDIDTDIDIPTPEKPKKIKFFGEDVDVVGIETNKKGQKVLVTDDGFKITVDDNNMPIATHNPKTGETATYKYDSNGEFESSVTKNSQNKIVSETEKQGTDWIEKDYKKGKEFLLGSDKQTILVERYMKLSEYPPNALIPDPATFSKNLAEQIDNCKTEKELNDLIFEYDSYKSQYGAILDNDLVDKFNLKSSELKAHTSTTPHQPKSKIITDPSFESKIKWKDFKNNGKNGLPLKYPHDTFISDLEQALDSLSPAEKAAVMKDFNIEFVANGSKKELKGIPNLDAKINSPAHQKIMDLLNKYAKENEIIISPASLKQELENFIQDVPEFSFMIGKAQNGIHSYSLDIHTLENLKNALKQVETSYPLMSAEDKEILKMSILLHDIGKQFKGTGISDTGHAALSKAMTEKILERFNYPQATKDRILNLIENHHWFKEFNKGNMSADDVINMFGSDLSLAKIMAKADLESVSDTFHLTVLDPSKTLTQYEYDKLLKQKMDSIKPSAGTFIGHELSIGLLTKGEKYILDSSKVDKLILGNNGFEFDINDPQFKKLCNQLNEGESFAIGCTNPNTTYADVKLQVGKYEDGVGSHHIVVTKKNGQIIIEPRKDVTVVKDIKTKVTSDPVLKAEIDKMRAKATKISTRTFDINGKKVPFEILEGTQGGSNPGFFAINKLTGEMFYVKKGGSQSKAELLAAQLYKEAGCNVPEITTFKDTDGSIGTMSKYEPGLTPITSANALVNDQFGMDVLTANWDAVVSNNTCLTKDGKAICIDTGGTFDFHAHQNSSKPFTNIPMELLTFFDGHNSTAAHIYSKLTREDLIKTLEKAVSLKDKDISSLASGAGVPHYADILIKRKKFLKQFLEELKKDPTPMGADKHAFIQKKYGAALEKMIEQAKSDGDLQDITQALDNIQDKNLKMKLQDLVQKQEAKLAAIAPKPKYLSEVQIQNMLKKAGFTQDYSGNLTLKFDNTAKTKYEKLYGSYQLGHIINKLEMPLTSTDIKNIQTMINEASLVMNIKNLDMQQLVLVYQNVKSSGLFHSADMSPSKWASILTIATTKPISADALAALHSFKGSSTSINHALSELAKIPPGHVSPHVQAQIDAIQSYLSTQILPESIKVTRVEGYYGSGNPYGCLHTATLPDGTPLDKALEQARLAGGQAIKDMEYKVNVQTIASGENLTATNERFTSTRIADSGSGKSGSGKIVWDLTIEKGSKGCYLEGNNMDGSINSEKEFILQKDSKFVITGIKWDPSIDKWRVTAKVHN